MDNRSMTALEHCQRYGESINHRWTNGKDREAFQMPNGDMIVFNPDKTVYLTYSRLFTHTG